MSLSLPLSPIVIELGRQKPSHSLCSLVTSCYTQGLWDLEKLNELLFRGQTVAGAELFCYCCFTTTLLRLDLDKVAGRSVMVLP